MMMRDPSDPAPEKATTKETKNRRELVLRWLLPIVGLALFFLLGQVLRKQMGIELFSKEGLAEFRNRLLAFGIFMPLAFCLLYSLRALFYMPEGVLMMTAGFLVGPFYGVLLVLLGSVLAASIAYGLAKILKRFGAKSVLEKLLRHNLETLENWTDDFGFKTLFIMRMMPIFPFTLATYGSALLNMKFHHFILAMGLGVIIPGFLYCLLGSSVFKMMEFSKGWQGFVIILLFIGLVLFLGIRTLKQHRLRKKAA